MIAPIFSLIIPCHNSSKFIDQTLAQLQPYFNKESFEIVFVENGSRDNTHQQITDYLSRNQVRNAIITKSEKGLGNALRAGFRTSKGDYTAFMADDLPHCLQEIEVLDKIQSSNGNLTVFLSKYLTPFRYGRSVKRVLQGLAFSLLRETFAKTGIRDTQGTFCGNGNNLRRIVSLTKEENYLITAEVALLLNLNGHIIEEVPISRINEYRGGSSVKFRDALVMLIGIFRMSRFHGKVLKSDACRNV